MKYEPVIDFARVNGRFTAQNEVLYLGYSASFLEFETDAGEMTVSYRSDDVPEEAHLLARCGVWVDEARKWNEEEQAFTAVLADDFLLSGRDTVRRTILGEAGKTKKVRIVKLSEAAFGLLGICSIEVPDGFEIRQTPEPECFIECIGDSITCGYGCEGKNGIDTFSTATENPLDAYAVKAAEKLGFSYELVSWSGIGVLSDWVPPEINRPRREILMQELYPYNDVRTEERLAGAYVSGAPRVITDDKTPCTFGRRPAAITIFLGTNDQSYTRKIPEREEDFSYEYERFLDMVHKLNPGTPILCMIGTQGTLLLEPLRDLVTAYAARHPEVHIHFLPLEEQPQTGKGADGHPNKHTHELVSEAVKSALQELLKS